MQVQALLGGEAPVRDRLIEYLHLIQDEYGHLSAAHLRALGEIMRLPMGYRTLIGGLGSSLSAGQRQRVLLARALYRRPSILFIDEGTANLDVDLDKRINQMLRTLPITRIQIAHRPQTIALADRVIGLGRTSEAHTELRLLAAE